MVMPRACSSSRKSYLLDERLIKAPAVIAPMPDIEVIVNRDTGVRVVIKPAEAPEFEPGDLLPDAFDWIGTWYKVWDPSQGYGWAQRAAHKTRIEPAGQAADVWFHFFAPLGYKGRELSVSELASIESRVEETLRAVLSKEVAKAPGCVVYAVAMHAPDYMVNEVKAMLEKRRNRPEP